MQEILGNISRVKESKDKSKGNTANKNILMKM
jgi:hypothetical protein